MFSIITGSIILSILHASIPNHWLPVIAIGRKEKWNMAEVSEITFISAIAHGLSTILIGLLLGMVGARLAEQVDYFTHVIGPVILCVLGVIFIYRHYKHRHFHVSDAIIRKKSKRKIITALVFAMFLSPCMEIEAYFLLAGSYAPWLIWFIAALYLVITTLGMMILVRVAYKGILRLDWHALEHHAGIITGITLVATGILSLFIH